MNAAASRLSLLLLLAALAHVAAPTSAPAAERLGTVTFAISCDAKLRAPFNRGVALLHDFWYEEARRQFEEIAGTNPGCAMAHWGIAMSLFQQIWDRPGEAERSKGWTELQSAKKGAAPSARERAYIVALGEMFHPGAEDFQVRANAYSARMAALYRQYPDDVDAGAFYALSLLAAEPVDDLSLNSERQALAVLNPLFLRYPDHPGLAHYIIHASDSPALAAQGLAAARRYGQIAPSAPHAAHMPGHIFARLGMWQEDIDANLASVEAARAAEGRHESGTMYIFHSNDFLLYAYLQAGEEARARDVAASSLKLIAQVQAMPSMIDASMLELMPYYRAEFPVMLDLELRDWKAAAALEPSPDAGAGVKMFVRRAHAIAAGHMHQGAQAGAELAAYETLLDEYSRGKYGYAAKSNSVVIRHGEVRAWADFARGASADALKKIRECADLEDRVGQGEVDIPAREMLGDMLLDLGRAGEALTEYQRSLELSPQRFNALYHAGMAAEAAHDNRQAARYYRKLLQSTGNGAQSTRPEFIHVQDFLTANP